MNTVIKTTKNIFFRWDVFCCLAMAIVFYSYPAIDIWVSNQFFDGEKFFLKHNPIVRFIYLVFAKIHIVLLLGFVLGLIFIHRKTNENKTKHKQLRYLLAVLLIAPGILVNLVLKDNSVGRPRPIHIEQYGGEAQFTPAFVYSGECSHNCSFTSGHAAVGFFFISLGWVFRCHKIFTLGILVGAIVGLGRIMQGGHFLSDVIFSFWVVYFTGLAAAYVYQFNLRSRNREKLSSA